MGVTAEPVEARVTRWPSSFPQYPPGHLARVAEIESAVDAASAQTGLRLAVAGAALRGLGIPACIRQGRVAGKRMVRGETIGGKK
jgi:oxygen-dependent protoporphyrinogen oxidase